MHIGAGVTPTKAQRIADAVGPLLAEDDELRAVFATKTHGMTHLAVTGRRLLGVHADRTETGDWLALDIGGGDMRGVKTSRGIGGSSLSIRREGARLKWLMFAIATQEREVIERFVTQVARAPAAPPAAAAVAQAADTRTAPVFGKINEKTLQEAWRSCRDGETPAWIASEPNTASGTLVAFADRCMIIKKGAITNLMAGSVGGGRITTFMYADITGIEYNSGWINGVLEILTPSYQGTANRDFWRGSNKGRNADSNDPYTLSNTLPWGKHFVEQIRPQLDWLRQQVAEAKRPVVHVQVPAAAGGADLAGELAKLAELHRGGALSDEEFAAAKQAVLARAGASAGP